jgi:outer membrane protein TolC
MNIAQRKEQHDSARLATLEQTARVRAARLRVEQAEAELRQEQSDLNTLIGIELDAWKQRHGYAMAESDQGQE